MSAGVERELDAPAQALGLGGVAGRFRQPRLHLKPRQQRPAPALRRGCVDRKRDHSGPALPAWNSTPLAISRDNGSSMGCTPAKAASPPATAAPRTLRCRQPRDASCAVGRAASIPHTPARPAPHPLQPLEPAHGSNTRLATAAAQRISSARATNAGRPVRAISRRASSTCRSSTRVADEIARHRASSAAPHSTANPAPPAGCARRPKRSGNPPHQQKQAIKRPRGSGSAGPLEAPPGGSGRRPLHGSFNLTSARARTAICDSPR